MNPVNKLKEEDVLKKIIALHGDDFDYSKFSYNGMHSKVIISCNKHGEFNPTPSNLLKGCKCQKCGIENRAKAKKIKAKESFVAKSIKKHGDQYDYSKVEYDGIRTKVKIICKIHGVFHQLPTDHLSGHGCKKCAIDLSSTNLSDSTNDFINKAIKIHGDLYDYSKSCYVNSKQKVIITCKNHGEFEQTPNCHLMGNGCPSCSNIISNPEKEIAAFIAEITPIVTRTRKIIPPKELDIYIPSHKIAIEYNGIFWHSSAMHYNAEKTHQEKHLLCKSKGIRLIQILEDDWILNKYLVKSMIKSALGLFDRTIYARNTTVKTITGKEARKFFIENHLNGFRTAQIHKGLFMNDELLMAVSISKPSVFIKKQEADLELLRMATKRGTRVHGGISKLISSIKFNTLLTFADAMWFDGSGYEAIGFENKGITKPGYSYVHPNFSVRKHRFSFTRKRIAEQFDNFDPELSEQENMANNGYYRLYDAGHYKFILHKKAPN